MPGYHLGFVKSLGLVDVSPCGPGPFMPDPPTSNADTREEVWLLGKECGRTRWVGGDCLGRDKEEQVKAKGLTAKEGAGVHGHASGAGQGVGTNITISEYSKQPSGQMPSLHQKKRPCHIIPLWLTLRLLGKVPLLSLQGGHRAAKDPPCSVLFPRTSSPHHPQCQPFQSYRVCLLLFPSLAMQ